jgi:archaeal type IV pilus assembly protein PilA
MNTLRKMRKNAKALSPVVASIILIAVTVAVSIAVAAWMGALVVGNMNTEELKVTNADFATSPGDVILTVRNTGASSVIVSDAYVGNAIAGATYVAETSLKTDGTVAPNEILTVTVTPTIALVSGQAYQFKLISTKGNSFVYTATAPL